jgi:predicted nucleic acid-binding protein
VGAEILLPGGGYLDLLRRCTQEQDYRGGGVFDLQIAALCIDAGIDTIWTFDRRFPRLTALDVVNPLTLL